MSEEKDLEEAFATGAKTVNEAREVLDIPPLDSGDVSLNPTYVKALMAKKEAIKPPQMITFNNYFMALGKPVHHRAGMEAFCNTKGKKTREAWKTLFAKY